LLHTGWSRARPFAACTTVGSLAVPETVHTGPPSVTRTHARFGSRQA
jgi:hypothetical protein